MVLPLITLVQKGDVIKVWFLAYVVFMGKARSSLGSWALFQSLQVTGNWSVLK